MNNRTISAALLSATCIISACGTGDVLKSPENIPIINNLTMTPEHTSKYTVEQLKPLFQKTSPLSDTEATRQAVAFKKFLDSGNKPVAHVIDPKTGDFKITSGPTCSCFIGLKTLPTYFEGFTNEIDCPDTEVTLYTTSDSLGDRASFTSFIPDYQDAPNGPTSAFRAIFLSSCPKDEGILISASTNIAQKTYALREGSETEYARWGLYSVDYGTGSFYDYQGIHYLDDITSGGKETFPLPSFSSGQYAGRERLASCEELESPTKFFNSYAINPSLPTPSQLTDARFLEDLYGVSSVCPLPPADLIEPLNVPTEDAQNPVTIDTVEFVDGKEEINKEIVFSPRDKNGLYDAVQLTTSLPDDAEWTAFANPLNTQDFEADFLPIPILLEENEYIEGTGGETVEWNGHNNGICLTDGYYELQIVDSNSIPDDVLKLTPFKTTQFNPYPGGGGTSNLSVYQRQTFYIDNTPPVADKVDFAETYNKETETYTTKVSFEFYDPQILFKDSNESVRASGLYRRGEFTKFKSSDFIKVAQLSVKDSKIGAPVLEEDGFWITSANENNTLIDMSKVVISEVEVGKILVEFSVPYSLVSKQLHFEIADLVGNTGSYSLNPKKNEEGDQ